MMPEKTLPFTKQQVMRLAEKHPTPFYIYHEKGIKETARRLNGAFSWVQGGFKNYFAVKACPNPYIVELLKQEGFGADCSSLPELKIAKMLGIIGENIMFTSNDTPAEEFRYAKKLGAIINLDDITHLDFLERHAGLPDIICFRYNPGKLVEGNIIIGKPENAKYGLTYDQLFKAYGMALSKGIRRFGLHTMVTSNDLDPSHFIEEMRMLVEIQLRLKKEFSINLEFINRGGGIGIPYLPRQDGVNLEFVSEGIRKEFSRLEGVIEPMPRLFMECGRLITGPHGYLVSTVRHVTKKHKDFVGLDACMANLMRPALYGAYHHIIVMGKEGMPRNHKYDVTGSLCENNDMFAIDRELPEIVPGDVVVIREVGGHGYAMGFQYNGKLRCAEFLMGEEDRFRMIRRAETFSDYMSTYDFPGSRFSSKLFGRIFSLLR
jgi:diaminopimelate decarboxylase